MGPAHDSTRSTARLGLGCVTFGREIDRTASFALMDYALANGVTTFDTAAAYGAGASETIVGDWLASRGTRERVSLTTKVLPPYSPASIEASLATSLGRLHVEQVDMLMLHRWDETARAPEVLRALDAVARSGRARAIGISNVPADPLATLLAQQAALGLARFRAIQNNHNFAVRDVDDALRAICAREDVAITTYSPLGAGFLTGKHESGVAAGSRFDIIPGHQRVYFNDVARGRLARLRAISEQTGVSMIQLALVWALHQPQVDTVLIGGRTPAHLDQALRVREFDDPKVLAALFDG